MKTPTFLSATALLGSGIAIVLAARQPAAPTQAEIDTLVDASLAARELRLVESVSPKFMEMFVEMGPPFAVAADWSPKTLEELIAPLVKVISSMGETMPDEPEKDGQGEGGEPSE